MDDVHFLAAGNFSAVADGLCEAIRCFHHSLGRAKLVLAGKSCIVGSSTALSECIVARLAEHNIEVVAKRSGRDLGVDCTAGGRRAVCILNARGIKGRAKTGRAMVLSKILKKSFVGKTSRLWLGSVAPTMLYGAVAGFSLAAQAGLRSAALRSCGAWAAGQCTTAALALAVGVYKDPAIHANVQVVMNWLTIMSEGSYPWTALCRAWQLAKRAFQRKGYTWQAVSGLVAAVQMVLHSIGWEAELPNIWWDAGGYQWVMCPNARADRFSCHELLVAVRRDLVGLNWERAAGGRLGLGLGGG